MERLVIIGAGGHAKVCFDIAKQIGKWKEILFLDDSLESKWCLISGKVDSFEEYLSTSEFFVAIGDNYIRSSLFKKIKKKGGNFTSLIHKSAEIGSDVKIGLGTCIMPKVVINSSVDIGENCILNTGSIVEHDSNIGNNVHLSPGVICCGSVRIGNSVWVGSASVIINNLEIGKNIVIGAGSTVITSLNAEGTYIGSPAILVKRRHH